MHDGIAQMFTIIEFARMMVGTKAIATLSTGYLNALEYAKTRVQGADLTQMTDKAAPRVTITHHPDVRRSLMTQKAYAEGHARPRPVHRERAGRRRGRDRHAGDGRRRAAERLNDLLLPIVKGYGSEKSYALLGSESLQTFGGSGYLQDYPLEQYIRDAKIDTLYEGTTAIQGMDLFFRKIVRDKGQALTALLDQVQEFAKAEAGNGALAAERELLLAGAGGRAGHRRRHGRPADLAPRPTSATSTRSGRTPAGCCSPLGDLVVALAAAAPGRGRARARWPAAPSASATGDFYTGKVAAARFFARQVLPLAVRRSGRSPRRTDNDLMDLPESAF